MAKQRDDDPGPLEAATGACMPRDWLLVNRLQLGLLSVLAHLRSTIPSRELFRAAREAPTAPLWRHA